MIEQPSNGEQFIEQYYELDIDPDAPYEELNTTQEALSKRETIWEELTTITNLSQRRIFHDVQILNRIAFFLVEQGYNEVNGLPTVLYKNYDIGVERIIKHPAFTSEHPNNIFDVLIRGLQQQEQDRKNAPSYSSTPNDKPFENNQIDVTIFNPGEVESHSEQDNIDINDRIIDPLYAQKLILETLIELAPADSFVPKDLPAIMQLFYDKVGKLLSDDLLLKMLLIPSRNYHPAATPELAQLAEKVPFQIRNAFTRFFHGIARVNRKNIDTVTLGDLRKTDKKHLLGGIAPIGQMTIPVLDGFRK